MSGEILVRHGGTFTITSQEYAEHVEYANARAEALVGRTFKFTFKVEGGRLTLIGIGTPWQEVWKRVKWERARDFEITRSRQAFEPLMDTNKHE